MNINQLKYFIAVAELQSFTKAAEQCFISQTAITQQVQALETGTGCRLLDRSTRPVSLTPAGMVFLQEARAVVERMDRALEKTRDASTGLVGNLQIGYIKGYERSSLSNLLRSYHSEHPNVLISCFRQDTDRLFSGLTARRLDLVFSCRSTALMQNPDIASRAIESSPLMAALYTGHPLARRTLLHRSDLKNETFLYLSPSESEEYYDDSYFMELYHKAGYEPRILYRSPDAESILMMVAAEEGIAILPDYFTRKLTNGENLVFLPLAGEDEVDRIYAFWRKDNENPALSDFINMLPTL